MLSTVLYFCIYRLYPESFFYSTSNFSNTLLTNFTPEYRLRVGDYRVLFELEEQTIIVYRVKHRIAILPQS
ncbi:MAG: type II toxin-antitoxin system RelE/ParE family toxin [Aphanizomenon gracile PMC638.10]|nr:type II toxin-antitoxin system RelE/ParE family toxin [Aphanizomenon gracile PMC638.10]